MSKLWDGNQTKITKKVQMGHPLAGVSKIRLWDKRSNQNLKKWVSLTRWSISNQANLASKDKMNLFILSAKLEVRISQSKRFPNIQSSITILFQFPKLLILNNKTIQIDWRQLFVRKKVTNWKKMTITFTSPTRDCKILTNNSQKSSN